MWRRNAKVRQDVASYSDRFYSAVLAWRDERLMTQVPRLFQPETQKKNLVSTHQTNKIHHVL